MQSTIIRSKEMSIINEEIPNKYFYLQEQQKQTKKTYNTITNWKKWNYKNKFRNPKRM